MMAATRDTPRWHRGAGTSIQPELPQANPEPQIDLDRLVWDLEYRDEMRRHLESVAQAA